MTATQRVQESRGGEITLVQKNTDAIDDAGDCSRGGAQGKQVSLVLFEYQPLEIII